RTRAGLVAQIAVVVGVVPLAVYAVSSGFAQVDWILPVGDNGISGVLGMVGAGSVPLALLLSVAALLGMAAGLRDDWRRAAPIAVWALAPFVAGFAISLYHSLLIHRYFIETVPAIALLAGTALVRAGSWLAARVGASGRVRDRGAALAGIAGVAAVAV